MNLRTRKIAGFAVIMAAMMSCNLPFTTTEPTAMPQEVQTATPIPSETSNLPPTFAPPVVAATSTQIILTDTPTLTPTITLEIPTSTITNTLVPYNPNASPTPPPTIPSGYNSATPGSAVKTATPKGPAPTARASFNSTAVLFTPTIDGNWGEWPNAEINAGYVVFGGGNWTGSSDLNASFKAAYDVNYLYIAVKVIDDVYAQNATGYQIYLGDSLEILMDTNLVGDYYDRGISSDDFQLGISPGYKGITGTKEAFLWYPQSKRGPRTGVVIASQSLVDGYMVEAAIPWSIFGISPASGQHYGFAVSVSDNDNTTQNLQESMVSSASGRRFLNPTTWGDLVLQ
jgi:hypothetical protein